MRTCLLNFTMVDIGNTIRPSFILGTRFGPDFLGGFSPILFKKRSFIVVDQILEQIFSDPTIKLTTLGTDLDQIQRKKR